MATFATGAEGLVECPVASLELRGWTFDPVAAELDVTSTNTAGWADFDPGLKTATGTFNAIWSTTEEPTPSLDPGETVELKLRIHDSTGSYYHIPQALLLGLPTVSVVDGQVTWTCNFRAKYDSGIAAAWVLV